MSEPTPREAIAELVHRYADAVVHRNGEQWGNCWAVESRWILSADRDVVGRDAIVGLWAKAMTGMAAVVNVVLLVASQPTADQKHSSVLHTSCTG